LLLQFINISWLGFIYLIVQLWKQVLQSSSAASTNAAALPMFTDWGTKTICLMQTVTAYQQPLHM
jgi:hypothetical protein